MSKRVAVLLTAAAVCASIAFNLWLWFALPSEVVPPLTFSPANVDLGTLFVRERKDFQIRITNTSKVGMVFESVRPSCSCSNVALSCHCIWSPGEEGLLTGSYRGRGRPGSVAQSIDLVVAKPRRVGIRIPVVGDVRSRIQVEPDVLVLERPISSARAVGKGAVVIRNASQETVKVSCRRAYRGVLPRPSRAVAPTRRGDRACFPGGAVSGSPIR